MKGILITSSLLIVLIAALRPLLRGRIDPRLQYALWLTVALRLLIPVNLFTSAYSALALLQRADRGTELVETIGQAHIPAQSYDSARAQVVEEYRRQGVSDSQLTPGDLMAIDTQARELMKGPTLAELAAKCARPVWLGGAALMALWFTAVNLKLRRRLRGAEWIEADCPLPVYVSDALPSPCLVGTVRPKIYVTPAALESPGRLRHVLAHELAHYRHKDHWWALVRCACLCLYWFDPLAWWAAALSRQDCELACDEGAIRALGEGERIPYGRTLVGMIAAGRTPLLQTATTMTGGKRRVKERIPLMARKPKTVLALALAAALILGCAVGCAFSGAPEKPMDAQRKPQLLELPSRLNDIPEELQPQVVNRPEDVSVLGTDGVLASYWWDVPADWEYDFMPWLLAVYQWDQTRLEEHLHPQGNGGYGAFDDVIVFAQDNDGHYFVFNQPTAGRFKMEGAEEYTAAFQAIRAFAEKKVLETEGVEPYNPSAQPLDTLQDRLLAVPEDWKDDVVSRVIDAAVDGGVAVGYSMNRPEWEELDAGLGWLLNIQQISRREYEAHIGRDNSGWACFARSGGTYFAVTFPTDVRFYSPDDAEPYHNAQDAVWAFVEKTVLSTQGVEPFDTDVLTPAQADIKPVTDAIVNAPSINMALSVKKDDGSSAAYIHQNVTDYDSYWARRLNTFATDYEWESYADNIPTELLYSMQRGGGLTVSVPNGGPALILHQTDNVIWVSHGDGQGTTLYRAVSHRGVPLEQDSSMLNPGPYHHLRTWYDEVELAIHQSTFGTVDDRGQSHHDIAHEWAMNHETALVKAAPGGLYSCTYVDVRNVQVETDWPENVRRSSAQRLGLPVEDFGKTWFPFTYQTVFVPENQSAEMQLMAGNTEEYAGSDVPEGAYIAGRVGYMILTDEGWTCRETGTGW